ncbi:MAG TPA: hypothetical protein DEA44_16055 [Firmicutes bacterium]|nr:hypothetical protein [Bacillota bacterium]
MGWKDPADICLKGEIKKRMTGPLRDLHMRWPLENLQNQRRACHSRRSTLRRVTAFWTVLAPDG